MPSISQRASASIKPLPKEERPISELYRLVALEWVDAEAAAHIQEELKTTTLEQWKNEEIVAALARGEKMADNHAERTVKAQPRWEKYIRKTCEDRANANRAKVKLKYYEMRYGEWNNREANSRHEAKLSR